MATQTAVPPREPAALDLALVAASLLPLVLFAALAWHSYRNAAAQAEAAVRSRVELLHGHTSKLIQVNRLLLERVRERFDALPVRAIAAAEKGHHDWLAGLRTAHPDVLGVSVIGPDGLGAAHSHLFPIPKANASDRDYFAVHRAPEGAGLYFSAPLKSRLVAEPGFVMSIRRGPPGAPFDGVYSASIRSGYVFDFWKSVAQEFGGQETMSLIRTDGVILVRFPNPGPEAPAKLGAASPLMERMAAGLESSVWRARSTVDGQERFFATHKVEGTPLYVNYGITTDAAFAAWRRDMALMGGLSAAATLALLALTLVVRRRNRSLREASRRKDEFLAALSHELRNPLAALMTSAELLKRGHLEPQFARDALAVTQRQLAQLRRLVDDLLDTARATHNKLVLARQPVSLLEAARAVLDAHPREAAITVSGEPVWANADPARLDQMIENLVDNAVKYGGRNVRLEVARRDGMAELRVSDDGEGIAPALMPQLFQPFMQGEQALDRARGGLGLGLALVRRLAELHGGTITAESAGEGRGASFTIRLPLAAAPAAPAGGPAAGTRAA